MNLNTHIGELSERSIDRTCRTGNVRLERVSKYLCCRSFCLFSRLTIHLCIWKFFADHLSDPSGWDLLPWQLLFQMLGSCAAGAQRLWLQLHARATRVGAVELVAAPREKGSLELRPCCRFCLRRDCPHSSTFQRRSTEPSIGTDVALRPKVADVAAACVAQSSDAVVEVSSEKIEAVELVTPVDKDPDRIWGRDWSGDRCASLSGSSTAAGPRDMLRG